MVDFSKVELSDKGNAVLRSLGLQEPEVDEREDTSERLSITQEDLWSRLLKQESGNRQFDLFGNVVESRVGALGASQVMPATAMDPGFGVPNVFAVAKELGVPVTERTKKEAKRLLGIESVNRQFGRAYFDMLADRYKGDMTKQLIAYNAGAGVADKYKGDPSTLPSETQGYIKKILAGVGEPTQTSAKPPAVFDFSSVELSDAGEKLVAQEQRRKTERAKGLLIEFGEGVTFGLLGELKSALEAASSDISYREAKERYEIARDIFKEQNPDLVGTSQALEFFGAIPSGIGLGTQLTRKGLSLAKAGGVEGGLYGFASGDSLEERVAMGTIGGLAGLTFGKVIDAAVTPLSKGGLKTQADDLADQAEAIDDQGQLRAIQEAEDAAVYTEVDNPQYTRTPLRDAQTAGELWDGMIGAVKNFYDDKLTGVSDRLIRRVSADVGGRFQRADETALRVIDKDLGSLQESLVPVIKIINESDRAKGVLLDYAAGNMLTKKQIFDFNKLARKLSPSERKALRKRLQAESLERLEKELAGDLNAEHMAALKRYLQYSANKNNLLNKKIFGADFDSNPNAAINTTFLHTRNRTQANRLKEEGMSEADIEKLFDDSAFQPRTRGRYLDEKDPQRPAVADYDNPIVSDMRRIFKMERLNQIQQKFGVKINAFRAGQVAATRIAAGQAPKTPTFRSLLQGEGGFPTEADGLAKWIEDLPEGSVFSREQWYNQAQNIDRSMLGSDSRNLTNILFSMREAGLVDFEDVRRITKLKPGEKQKPKTEKIVLDADAQPDPLYKSQLQAASFPNRALTPTQFMDAFELTLRKKGISDDGAAFARKEITEAIMGQSKTPHPLIQAANSTAYALTLAGPLSAVLNLADIPLVGAKYGGSAVREGMKAVVPGKFKDVPNVDLQKAGLGNQTFGEFVNIINDQASDSAGWMVNTAERMRKGADFLMRKSGFAAFDQIGKQGVMRGVLKSAADDAEAGKLADNWGFYFNEAELDIIQSQLKRHGADWRKYTGKGKELVEELMFAGLGQQQLISAAGRPAAWARHPNLRPLWALRGFVVKQQALALREVVGNLKAGRPDKAAEFLGRYAAYGAGGYAIINEGRQFIFGDGEVSAGGIARGYGDAWASLLTANTLGLNDYQFGKIKENGIMLTFAQGLMPITVTRPFDIAGTTIGVIDREYPVARLAQELPIFRDAARVTRNVGELTGQEELQDIGGMLTQKRLPQD